MFPPPLRGESDGDEFRWLTPPAKFWVDDRRRDHPSGSLARDISLRSVPRSVDDPLSTDAVNVAGTLGLLMACREAGVRRLVYASSSSVYGDGGTFSAGAASKTASGTVGAQLQIAKMNRGETIEWSDFALERNRPGDFFVSIAVICSS